MEETKPAVPKALEALRKSLPARFKAAGIHLSLSLVVFAVAMYLILVEWYPGFHFLVDGGWHGVKIMAGVDLVLGPMLTLIIFNPFKARRLIVIDLACIGITQVGALAWGFYAVNDHRPVVVSYYEGAFLSVTRHPLAAEKQPADFAEQFSDRRPPWVYVRPPKGDEEEARAAMQEVMGQVGFHEDPFFFERLEPHWADVAPHAAKVEARSRERPAFAAELPDFLARHGGQAADYLFFPYTGSEGDCTVAFKRSGEWAGALDCQLY